MEVVHRPVRMRIAELVCPELRAIPAGDRERALHDASGVPFDIAELVGVALGLVLVAWLTRHGAHALGPYDRMLALAANALIARGWDVTVDGGTDYTAPVITSVASSTTMTTAIITWTTNEAATSVVHVPVTVTTCPSSVATRLPTPG